MQPREAGGPLTLTVGEAQARDVGRGLARLVPSDLAALGLQPGEIVEIVGSRATVARAMPIFEPGAAGGTLQIDGIVRGNAQVTLGDEVQLARGQVAPAEWAVFSPATPSDAFVREDAARYLGRVLNGLPVTQGDRVRASLFGSRYQEFTVVDTAPSGAVLLTAATRVRVRSGPAAGREPSGVTYEDIGALRRELQRVREMIELPLRHPELFERLGIEPPKGVLLYGPPGTGKTLIARAVASETDAAFFALSGPEVIHKFYGESEAHLRAVFERASAEAPAIVFIDEIDAIATKREEVRGDQQVERRVVAQLLSLLDGLRSRGQVIVIGATNIPQVLDPALRRPGRFDREIAIGVPDRDGRLEILQIHSRGMPLADDVGLERLAEITPGFVGADLEALCREAAMATLREVMPRLHRGSDGLAYDLLAALEVRMEHFLIALSEIEPSAIREVSTEAPRIGWDEVGGLTEAKRALIEAVSWPLKYPRLFRQADAAGPRGVLLSGPPGSGKTLLARALARQAEVSFITVKGSSVLSKWVGETEQRLSEVFRKARHASPCLIFLDELDALAPARSAEGSAIAERLVAALLAELDGIETLAGLVVLAATNRPDLVDPALLRAGRFDLHLQLPLPDAEARREIFAIHTRGKPLDADVSLDRLAARTEGASGAVIAACCRAAALRAVREQIEAQGPAEAEAEAGAARLTLRAAHFEAALRERAGSPGDRQEGPDPSLRS
jgi:transitional endoplasmic reticulum ATPase